MELDEQVRVAEVSPKLAKVRVKQVTQTKRDQAAHGQYRQEGTSIRFLLAAIFDADGTGLRPADSKVQNAEKYADGDQKLNKIAHRTKTSRRRVEVTA